MSKVTVVSALFNIDRVDGRKWHEYMEWFETFLELKVPMILFTTEDIAEFIKENIFYHITYLGNSILMSSKHRY